MKRLKENGILSAALAAVMLLVGSSAFAAFDSGSTGADGVLELVPDSRF